MPREQFKEVLDLLIETTKRFNQLLRGHNNFSLGHASEAQRIELAEHLVFFEQRLIPALNAFQAMLPPGTPDINI